MYTSESPGLRAHVILAAWMFCFFLLRFVISFLERFGKKCGLAGVFFFLDLSCPSFALTFSFFVNCVIPRPFS
jgi:hypothetical protein